MSYPSINNDGVNNEFSIMPTPGIPTPSVITYIPVLQNLGTGSGTVGSGLTNAPLIISPASSATWILPPATSYNIGGQTGPQVGDVYLVPVLNLGAEAATFEAGVGGTGTKSISASFTSPGYLIITFIGSSPASYTLN